MSDRGCSLVSAPPPPLEELFCGSTINVKQLKRHFELGGRLHEADAVHLIELTTSILRNEPNVLTLRGPLTICGDIHGQYYDLMTLFALAGDPPETQFLFLGDYVDRGCFSTEVTLLIYAWKVMHPDRVWLLRGNHECRHLTSYFNFKAECLNKYSPAVYDTFQSSFDALPLAAILNERFLCVHGGLSPEIRAIDDISLIDRFREPPTSGPMCDLLWSDPMEEEEEQLCPDALYLFNELRGCSYVFSYAATLHFLQENNLAGVIRAHEAQDEGYRMFRKVPSSGFPSIICVFSAPNYCDSYENKAAILQISDGQMLHIRQFHSVCHPYCLPNFMNAFEWSLPFVWERTQEVVETLNSIPIAAGVGVLQRRGRLIRAKVVACVKWILLLKRLRRYSEQNI